MPLDPRVDDAAAQLLVLRPPLDGGRVPSFEASKKMRLSDRENIPLLRKMLSPELERAEERAAFAKWTRFEKQLLDLEQAVADQVLHSHVAGFSTTPGDLMHDLLP